MGVIYIDEASQRESLELDMIMFFPWDGEPSGNYNALLNFYVQARAEEEGMPIEGIDQDYRDSVWEDVCKLADERAREIEEMNRPRMLPWIIGFGLIPYDLDLTDRV